MRLLITSDLHYNHRKSRQLAEELIARVNQTGGDVLVVIGDTAVGDGDSLEQCLELFRFAGPKLFIAGNHELWTEGPDSHDLFTQALPIRIRRLGWTWLEDSPAVFDKIAIIGSIGWYDYSFAQASLGIPRRFYEAKVSPGAAERFESLAHLLERSDDVSPHAREIIARWNDGRFIKLHRSDEQFLAERLDTLRQHLESVRHIPQVIVAVHHLPFAELLPPPRTAQWDFAKAYLGSRQIGDLLLEFPNITHAFCGHSHFPAAAQIRHIRAINTGCGYRHKTVHTLDLPD
jgi:predicted phosphodiesterase